MCVCLSNRKEIKTAQKRGKNQRKGETEFIERKKIQQNTSDYEHGVCFMHRMCKTSKWWISSLWRAVLVSFIVNINHADAFFTCLKYFHCFYCCWAVFFPLSIFSPALSQIYIFNTCFSWALFFLFIGWCFFLSKWCVLLDIYYVKNTFLLPNEYVYVCTCRLR